MIEGGKIVYTPCGPSMGDSGAIVKKNILDSEWNRSPCVLTSHLEEDDFL